MTILSLFSISNLFSRVIVQLFLSLTRQTMAEWNAYYRNEDEAEEQEEGEEPGGEKKDAHP